MEKLEGVTWEMLEKCLDKVDALWQAKYEGFMKESLVDIAKIIRIEKFEKKLYKITKDCPIVYSYFTEYEPVDPERDPFEYVLAHNGWTEVTEEFVSKDTFHYLRRKLGIWNCIKLYYGNRPSDSPFIWSYMEKYITAMAEIFQGFRIDNCHSTPRHVLSYLLRQARAVNPDLFVYAELYAGGLESEMAYVKMAGLNALMRELAYVNDAGALAHAIGWDGTTKEKPCELVEFGEGQKLILLKSTRPKALLYDITHDNPAPMEKWNAQAVLPLICAATMSQVAVGSTLAVDVLVPYNLSVAFERRLYEPVCCDELRGFMELVKDDKCRVKSEEEEKKKVEITYKCKADKVAVLGGFNNWNKTAKLMEKTGDDDMWKASLLLAPGQYPYKFLVNDKDWMLGPGETLKDYLGNINNILRVECGKLPEAKIFDNVCVIRRIMNELHTILGIEKAALEVRSMDDMIIITRTVEKKSYILIARTHFIKGQAHIEENISKTIHLPGKLTHVVFSCNLYVDPVEAKRFVPDPKTINGLKGKLFFHQGEASLKYFANLKRGVKNDILEFFKVPCNLCTLLIINQTI